MVGMIVSARLQLALAIKSGDGELAAEHIDGERVVTLSIVTWFRIRLARLDHALLIAAESGGTGAVNALVGELPALPTGDASPIAR
jgi:hypothetical protein